MKSSVTLCCLCLLLLIAPETFGESVVVSLGGGFYLFNITHTGCAEFDTVESDTGKVWMDRNLGACRVAQSFNDGDAFGDLYQWGRDSDGHEKRDSTTVGTQWSGAVPVPDHSNFISGFGDWLNTKNDNIWQGVDGTNNPCPSGFRLPTADEWEAEIATWNENNSVGALNSPLRLVTAGYRAYTGELKQVADARYWSSSVVAYNARYLYFHNQLAVIAHYNRAFGNSVRCIKD